MDCNICFMSLVSGKQISTTTCGHVFHHACLKDWISRKPNPQERVCPNCIKVIDINRNVVIYLGDEQSHQDLVQSKINEINTNLDRQQKSIHNAFESIMTVITEQNAQLRKEIHEIKGNPGGSNNAVGSSDNDQAKDELIKTLRKEIQDLKLQRAETAKHMETIQKQVSELKLRQSGDRGALKAVNGDQKQPMSLSLKFDDFSTMDKADRLIFQ